MYTRRHEACKSKQRVFRCTKPPTKTMRKKVPSDTSAAKRHVLQVGWHHQRPPDSPAPNPDSPAQVDPRSAQVDPGGAQVDPPGCSSYIHIYIYIFIYIYRNIYIYKNIHRPGTRHPTPSPHRPSTTPDPAFQMLSRCFQMHQEGPLQRSPVA